MNSKLLVGLFGAAAGCLVSLSASAQTCAEPTGWQPPASGDSKTVNTCTGDTIGGLTTMCQGFNPVSGPLVVFKSNFTADRTFTKIHLANNTGGTFHPVVYMTPIATGCGNNMEICSITGDAETPADVTSAMVSNGEYLIIITSHPDDAHTEDQPSCGSVTVSADGSFPVTLTNFTIS